MTKSELVILLKSNAQILPKDILADVSFVALARLMLQILEEEKPELESNETFQQNYIELINYILLADLAEPASKRKKFFDMSFLNAVLSLPVHS